MEKLSENNSGSAPNPTPFERMQALAMRVLSVPKSEVDKREEEWRNQRSNKKPAKAA